MPISHKHKTIFVHIPKTAGTSIEKILGIGGINKKVLRTHEKILINKIQYAPQHFTATILKNNIWCKDHWNDYFKFSIVRNPYTRVLSEYFWTKGKTKQHLAFDHKSFDNFLSRFYSSLNRDHKLSQTTYLYEGQKLLVNKVFHFERLKATYRFLRKKCKVKVKLLPHTQKSSNKIDYLNALTSEQKDFIFELYKDDFKNFKYNR